MAPFDLSNAMQLFFRKFWPAFIALWLFVSLLSLAQANSTKPNVTDLPAKPATLSSCNLSASRIEQIAVLAKYKIKAPIRYVQDVQGLNSNIVDQDTAYVMCKPWESGAGRRVMLVVMPSAKIDRSSFELDMLLIVADSDDRNSVFTVFPKFISSDDIKLTDILLDTGGYRLAVDKPAFGVWLERMRSSRVNPYSDRTLSVFVVAKNKIYRVLDKLPDSVNQSKWDGGCAGEFVEIERTIDVSKESSHGYLNLIVKENRTLEIAKSIVTSKGNEDCKKSFVKSPLKTFTLRFNGDVYQAPVEKN